MKYILLLLFLILSHCASAPVKQEQLKAINQKYSDKTYYMKKDMTVGQGVEYKRRMAVKIWFEVTPSLLKLKCYPVQTAREHAAGRMVAYKVIDENVTEADFQQLIDEVLEPYSGKK